MSPINRRWIAAPTLLAILALAACGGTDRQASTDSTAAPAATTATTAPAATDGADTTVAGTDTTATGSTDTTAAGGAETTAPADSADSVRRPPLAVRPGDRGQRRRRQRARRHGRHDQDRDGRRRRLCDQPGSEPRDDRRRSTRFAAKCNELGGINGRQIKVNYYDAAITNIATAIQGACDGDNFFLVGEGWSFDSGQEEIRHNCGLPAVPTYTVSAAFAMAPDVYQGVPNPADETPSGIFAMIAELFPDEVKAVATLGGNYSATQETVDKVRAVAPEFGWNFVGRPDRVRHLRPGHRLDAVRQADPGLRGEDGLLGRFVPAEPAEVRPDGEAERLRPCRS